MRGHFAGGIDKRLQRGLARRHPRIVKDEAVGVPIAAPLAKIVRGHEASDERTIRAKTRRHVPRPEPRAARERTAPWRERRPWRAKRGSISTRRGRRGG